MSGILTEIVTLLTGGITEMGTGIGTGLNNAVTKMFIDGTGEAAKLSTLGSVIAIFGGIGLAVGLTTLVTKWIMSLGGRH